MDKFIVSPIFFQIENNLFFISSSENISLYSKGINNKRPKSLIPSISNMCLNEDFCFFELLRLLEEISL